MFETLFSFRGAIGRRTFLLGSLALFGGVMVVALVGGVSLLAITGASKMAVSLFSIALGLLAGWPSTALVLKRLRDLGVSTLPGLALAYVPGIASALLARIAIPPHGAAIGLQALATITNLALIVVCCAVKGRPDARVGNEKPIVGQAPARLRPPMASTAPRTQFGQRGV